MIACYWDHIESIETGQMYDAFSTYLALGHKRTYTRVAELHQLQYAKVCGWAREAVWKERTEEYDKHLIAERAQLLEAARVQQNTTWAERRAGIMNELESIATMGAAQLLHEMRTRRRALRPNELRLIIETLTKWQNLANGEATEKIDFGLDLAKLSDTELEQYEAFLEKASTDETQTAAEPQVH